MKIVLISQNASPGLLIFRADFIKYLTSKGYIVYAFALDFNTDSRAAVEKLGAIPIDYSLSKSGMNPIRDLRDTLSLAKKIKSIEPYVVFSFFVKPSIYGTLAAKLAKVPRRIAMLEGLGYMHTPTKTGFSFKKHILQRVHGLLCSVSYSFADEVIFLNPDDPIDLSKRSILNKSKLKVLGPIGLDLSLYPYVSLDVNKPVRFIFIARLLAEKGIFDYLDAAKIVKKYHPEAEFVVLGGLDPDNPAALNKSQLDKVISENIIIYPGHVSNVSEWIADSHVFVLPSYYREGVPRSAQEAMAIGRAVITTDVPGCRETVKNEVNGFLVPPWAPELLAEKMMLFINNPELLKKMGDESYKIAVENFNVHKVNAKLKEIILGDMNNSSRN